MSDSPIPLIDLQKFSSAGELERARVIAEVRKALEEVGFLLIKGHGVDQALIDRVTAASLTFFDRAEADKLKYCSAKPGARGYNRMRGRTVGKAQDSTYLASLQESYAVGRPSVRDGTSPWPRLPAAATTTTPWLWA